MWQVTTRVYQWTPRFGPECQKERVSLAGAHACAYVCVCVKGAYGR